MAKHQLACGLLIWFSMACTQPKDKVQYPIVAKILRSFDADYRLAEVTIDSLTDLDHMAGTVGTIKGQAALNVNADIDEIVSSQDPEQIYSDRGHTVQTDYLVRGGVVIPQNFQTMEMLSLYYAYEQTLGFWAKNFDVPFDSIGLPSIFYNPRLASNQDGEDIEVSTTMNAAYLPGVRDFWFFKTASRERVPVKMNYGVIAHEFGHFIFDYRFANLDRESYSTKLVFNDTFLAGLNEGLADYFSYLVTGSVEEFAASLPEISRERRMPVAWTLRNANSGVCRGGFYCQGSVLASALHEISLLPGQDSLRVAQSVYKALPTFYNSWMQQRDTELVNFSSLLNAVLAEAGADRTAYCSVFKKWFDTDNVRLNLACPS